MELFSIRIRRTFQLVSTVKIHMMEKCKSDTKKLYCNGKDMQRYQAAEYANLISPANTL